MHFDEGSLIVQEADNFIGTEKNCFKKSNRVRMVKETKILIKGWLDIKVESAIYQGNE